MRVLILALSALSALGVLVSADAASANPSTTTREWSASVEPATSADEATQASQATQKIQATAETEGRIGLDKRKRRDVQRALSKLGFDTKISGKFDDRTRAAITRWQEARGYPQTGFLDTAQHEALRTEFISVAQANSGSGRPSGGGARHHRSGGGGGGGGGPVRLIGGVVGGLFGHR
jgi:peptidoglycan hydrolase-like protein with peptidoglycan-binding domain